MSGIFAYTGNESAKEILISGLSKLENRGNKTSGIVLKENGAFLELKVKAPPCELETKQLESNSKIGIAQCSDEGRCTLSAITSPPAANKLFAVALDGDIYNFNALKRVYRNQMPILSDEELILACLSAFKEENKSQITQKMSELFFESPSFAFISADEDAIYCKSGVLNLIIGISQSGVFLSSELYALASFCDKYTVLQSGESAKLTKDKISVFDSKQRKIKKSFTSIYIPNSMESSHLPFDDVYYAPIALKETYRRFVSNQQFCFDYLKLRSRYINKINKIILIASPSSKYAAGCAKSLFETYCSVCVCFADSFEFLCSKAPLDKNTLVIALSKSGEDKNTLLSVKKAKENKAKTIALTCNSLSALARESDKIISPMAYYESSKLPVTDFITDYLALCLFSLYLGYETDIISELYLGVSLKMAEMLSGILSASLKSSVKYEKAAALINISDSVYICSAGCDNSLSIAAAKIIRDKTEKNVFAVSLFDLEEYPPSLTENSLVIALITDKECCQKTLMNIIRIKNRGAKTVIITGEGIRQEIEEFENIISFNDSLPAFNPIPFIAAVYKIALITQEKEEEKEA